LRARLESAVEHFVDVAWEPDDLVVQRIKADRLHVLVDLKGYTAGDRLRVMAQRPCPVQVAWLGYPATTGAPFIDYLIADPIIVPADAERHYSERVLRLPHCYQPNDRKRAAALPRSRAEYGLPDGAFVFCCFNQTVKITPDVFSRWMNLLKAVPHGILWLLEDNRWANENILNEAQAAGVDRTRIVIAPRLPPAEHLARYRAADLALDTFPYASHTTGSDALWVGCPLVALCGETFASRVSASLLANCGFPELVTHALVEYEQLALRLATDAAYLCDVRARLETARDTAPLFDATTFTRDLEALYQQLLR
jgi:predicted O-linked N-acetylglucosamine transferase (SPINDLY family)